MIRRVTLRHLVLEICEIGESVLMRFQSHLHFLILKGRETMRPSKILTSNVNITQVYLYTDVVSGSLSISIELGDSFSYRKRYIHLRKLKLALDLASLQFLIGEL